MRGGLNSWTSERHERVVQEKAEALRTGMLRCSGPCQQMRHWPSDFSKQKNSYMGTHRQCKYCRREWARDYYRAHPEKVTTKNAALLVNLLGSGMTIRPGTGVTLPPPITREHFLGTPQPVKEQPVMTVTLPTPAESVPRNTDKVTLDVWLSGGDTPYALANERLFVIPGRLAVRRVKGRYQLYQPTGNTTPGSDDTMDAQAVRIVLKFLAPDVLALSGDIYKL